MRAPPPLLALALLLPLLAGCTAPPGDDGLQGGAPLPGPPGTGSGSGGSGGSGSGGGAGTGATGAPGEWRQFPLDVRGTRYQAAETRIGPATVGDLRLLWAHRVDGAPTGTPVVADGRVYFGTWDGHLHALDARTGEPVWTYKTQGQVDGTVAVVGGWLYAGDAKAWLYKLDAATGEEAWRVVLDDEPGSHLYSSPLVHDGLVYIGIASDQHSKFLYPEPQPLTFRGSVVAVDTERGKVKWQVWVQPPDGEGLGGSVWASPVLDPATMTLYVGTGNAYTAPAGDRTDAVLAIGARDGDVKWVFQATKDDVWTQRKPEAPDWDFGASPVVVEAGGRTLVVAPQKSGVVWARDAATGEAVWQHGTPKGGQDITASPAVKDGVVFVASQGEKLVRAIALADGELRWERDLNSSLFSSPAVVEGLVLVGTSGGHLVALDEATGEERWRTATEHGGIFGGISVSDGVVYAGAVPKGYLGDEGWLLAWGLP